MGKGQRTDRSDSPHMPVDSSDEEKNEKKKTGRTRRALCIAVGVTVLTAIAITGSGCGNNDNADALAHDSTTTPEAPANPDTTDDTFVETSTTSDSENGSAEGIPTVESLELDASLLEYPEALMKKFMEGLHNGWTNAGATPENARAAMDSSLSLADYAALIAAEYDKVYIDALLIEGWEANPTLAKWVNKSMIPIHAKTLALYFITSFPDSHPLDKEPYERTTEIRKIISATRQDDGSLEIVNIEYDRDNSDMNRVGEDLTDGKTIDGNDIQPTWTFVDEDGKVKISDLIFGKDLEQ